MQFKFRPLKTFQWVREYEDGSTVFMGEYHPNMTYNCTKEPRHDALREQCKVWRKEGKIVIIPLTGGESFKTIPLAKEDK